MKYNEELFNSAFSNELANYLNEKELLGQQTRSLFFQLRDFDNMCRQLNISENILTKEIVKSWLKRKANESLNNLSKRASIIRCFGKYMYRFNTKNYILPCKLYPTKEKYYPHIYTKDEIKKLFYVIDNIKATSSKDYKPDTMPVIYRLLLFTGMRINEILSLKIKDINYNENTLIVKNAKNHKDRLIIISDKLCNKLKEYNDKHNNFVDKDEYFFRNSFNRKITTDSFYEHFRKYLWQANIHHTGHGPRVHDFRHTFTVNCIHKWLIEGKDLKVFLPYLQTYLGHGTIEATYYYYNMTLGIYPYLENKSTNINDIIPVLEEEIDDNE